MTDDDYLRRQVDDALGHLPDDGLSPYNREDNSDYSIFIAFLNQISEEAKTWPHWKRNLFGPLDAE